MCEWIQMGLQLPQKNEFCKTHGSGCNFRIFLKKNQAACKTELAWTVLCQKKTLVNAKKNIESFRYHFSKYFENIVRSPNLSKISSSARNQVELSLLQLLRTICRWINYFNDLKRHRCNCFCFWTRTKMIDSIHYDGNEHALRFSLKTCCFAHHQLLTHNVSIVQVWQRVRVVKEMD